jgi:phospholipid/cholesterol/gamma-HCH transport system substrate-binding protein
MKTTPSQKIKIGLFALVGLAVLLAAIYLIGQRRSLFTSTFNVYGKFHNVNGLVIGNNVRFAGINVGVVDDISILNDSTVKVTLTLNNSVKKFIKRDSKMSIGTDGLMGDKLVVIAPGTTPNSEEIKEGGELSTVNPLQVDKLMNKLTKIADNAGTLIQNLTEISEKVNSGHGSLGRLINNDKMAKDLDATVKSAQKTITTVHKTSSTLNEDLKAAQHNFLLKGFFKKKKKAQQDSIKKAQNAQQQK